MRKLIRLNSLLICVILILSLIFGCTAQQTPQQKPATSTTSTVTKWEKVTLHAIHDVTGPYSATVLPSVNAGKDFTKWYNAKGGLDGVPVEVVWDDTRGELAAAVTAYNKVRDEKPKPVMVGVYLSSYVDALSQRFIEDRIPCNTTSVTQKAVWPPGWVYAIAGTYPDLTGTFIDWLSAEWEKSGQTRKCRIALFNPDYAAGRSSSTPEVIEYIKTKPNIELVANEYFDYKALDLSSDIMKVMQTNPDWLYGFYYATSGAAFYKSLDSAGYSKKVRVGNVLWGLQSENAKLVAPELIEGVTGAMHLPPFLPKGQKQVSPGMEFVEKLFEENNNPQDYRGGSYVSSIQFWFWLTGIMEKALATAGWEKFGSEACYKAFESTRSMDLGGLMNWGIASGTRYNNKCQMYQFKNGIPMPITGTQTSPDLRPSEYRTAEYSWEGNGWPKDWFKK